MLKTIEKDKIIKKFRSHGADTGSSEVQIALLTEEIKRLTDHLKKNKKDHHSRRGLLKMVSKRKTLLNYVARSSEKRYNKITKKLDLKK